MKNIFLQKQALRIYNKVKRSDPDNITGFRIGRKVTNGNISRNYSIIFQVVEKRDLNRLDKGGLIPEEFNIRFPDKKERIVKTDVEQTGEFKLHGGVGGEVTSSLSNPGSYGTAGLFVSDNGQRTLMITNYHVVAENLMKQCITYYRRPAGNTDKNVRLRLPGMQIVPGIFDEGRIDNTIDVAFVEVPDAPDPDMNMLGNGIRVQGRVTNQPIPDSFVGRGVYVFSNHHPQGISSVITSVTAAVGNSSVNFSDLLQIQKVTSGGDSGSLVVTPNYLALAIIIGADDKYSYAIPFYQITNFKSFQIP